MPRCAGLTRQWLVGAGTSITGAQQNDIFPVKLASGETEFLWTGDRWQSALATDGLKSHDNQYWTPLQFDSDGNVATLQWDSGFSLEMP